MSEKTEIKEVKAVAAEEATEAVETAEVAETAEAKEAATKKRQRNISIIAFVIVILFMGGIYFWVSPSSTEGAKAIEISVTDDAGVVVEYDVNTDAEYLRGAMDDAEGLEYSGTESEYGLMVETVNGVTADYNADGAYWAFYVDGEYCQYGIDSQPVADGESYSIVYTK